MNKLEYLEHFYKNFKLTAPDQFSCVLADLFKNGVKLPKEYKMDDWKQYKCPCGVNFIYEPDEWECETCGIYVCEDCEYNIACKNCETTFSCKDCYKGRLFVSKYHIGKYGLCNECDPESSEYKGNSSNSDFEEID